MKMQTATPFKRGRKIAARLWLGIREWCGDTAYERYVEARTQRACSAAALSREEFYVEQLQKRYSRVSRCC